MEPIHVAVAGQRYRVELTDWTVNEQYRQNKVRAHLDKTMDELR